MCSWNCQAGDLVAVQGVARRTEVSRSKPIGASNFGKSDQGTFGGSRKHPSEVHSSARRGLGQEPFPMLSRHAPLAWLGTALSPGFLRAFRAEVLMSRRPDTCGFNHVATMTANLDRYLEFYGDVFGAEVITIMEAHDDHPRMAIVNMGGNGALNVFEVPADSVVGNRSEMGGRGPIDHYALAVKSEELLLEIRDRLVARGASPGEVTQFGPALLSVFFRDPDGAELEVAYLKT
jgi:catechol 2,3-dioxygenase-like lactoylglutathione lyase family enzyme